jgi:serine/threonine protein kinase
VHRDIKPDNILRFNQRWKIGDFSLLGTLKTEMTRIGTPQYTAPAYFTDDGGNPDMWGMATTLYTFLTGNLPDKMGKAKYKYPPLGVESLDTTTAESWDQLFDLIYRITDDDEDNRVTCFHEAGSFLDQVGVVIDKVNKPLNLAETPVIDKEITEKLVVSEARKPYQKMIIVALVFCISLLIVMSVIHFVSSQNPPAVDNVEPIASQVESDKIYTEESPNDEEIVSPQSPEQLEEKIVKGVRGYLESYEYKLGDFFAGTDTSGSRAYFPKYRFTTTIYYQFGDPFVVIEWTENDLQSYKNPSYKYADLALAQFLVSHYEEGHKSFYEKAKKSYIKSREISDNVYNQCLEPFFMATDGNIDQAIVLFNSLEKSYASNPAYYLIRASFYYLLDDLKKYACDSIKGYSLILDDKEYNDMYREYFRKLLLDKEIRLIIPSVSEGIVLAYPKKISRDKLIELAKLDGVL